MSFYKIIADEGLRVVRYEDKISYGQYLARRFLKRTLGHYFLENFRPFWLNGLELDYYYPRYQLGVEFNGDQHYFHTSFGSPDAQRRRDIIKKQLCKENNVRLVILHARDLNKKDFIKCFQDKLGKDFFSKNKLKKFTYRDFADVNNKSIKYRHILKNNFNSRTA
jgi:hypothetical protein